MVPSAIPDPLEHEILPSLDQLPGALALLDGAPPDDRVVVRVGDADDAFGEGARDDDRGLGGAPGGVEPVLVEEVLARGLGEELVALKAGGVLDLRRQVGRRRPSGEAPRGLGDKRRRGRGEAGRRGREGASGSGGDSGDGRRRRCCSRRRRGQRAQRCPGCGRAGHAASVWRERASENGLRAGGEERERELEPRKKKRDSEREQGEKKEEKKKLALSF